MYLYNSFTHLLIHSLNKKKILYYLKICIYRKENLGMNILLQNIKRVYHKVFSNAQRIILIFCSLSNYLYIIREHTV